ncbi:MAG: PilN domain-containing protein [Gemmatimonadales bacterium]|nr:PilN domain-containing protein [Gemmatimonadales bacterium]
MITVNLRPDLKRQRARSPLQGVMESLRGVGTKVKDPLLVASVVAWVGVLGWLGYVVVGTTHELNALEPKLEQTRAEHKRFKAFLAEKRHQETIRDSLVAQIGVIRTVDGDRYVWPHLLDEVTKALPPYTWLVDLGFAVPAAPAPGAPQAAGADQDTTKTQPLVSPAVAFNVNGRTVDIQAYTRFLRQLEASPWITDVTPVAAQTVIEKERPVTAFTIRATYRQADSAYIRTVPLSESVR